jgi:hypothetical protein
LVRQTSFDLLVPIRLCEDSGGHYGPAINSVFLDLQLLAGRRRDAPGSWNAVVEGCMQAAVLNGSGMTQDCTVKRKTG